MKAGKYRHLVRLQKEVFTPDGQGGFSKDWTDIDEIHAEVTTGSGSELMHAGALEYTVNYKVSMRWRQDLTPAQRLIWVDGAQDRILDVAAAVNPDGFHRELVMTAIERVPGPGPEL